MPEFTKMQANVKIVCVYQDAETKYSCTVIILKTNKKYFFYNEKAEVNQTIMYSMLNILLKFSMHFIYVMKIKN